MSNKTWNVLVTGGAGYVGSVLVPKLLAAGHRVTVLDLYLYGEDLFAAHRNNPNLIEVKGDLRDPASVKQALAGCNAVIHLACISNDPSFELNPGLGKSINYDCFLPLVKTSKDVGVKRFVYASSSSVYGVKKEAEVTEELALEPLTDYSKFKAMCEDVLEKEREPGFTTLTLCPATVCGFAPRQRLDVIVNIFTNHAVNTGRMKVFGGSQLRPNLHIEDMTDLYLLTLQLPAEQIDGRVYNAGYENQPLMHLAEIVRSVAGKIEIDVMPTNDLRSYQVSSKKILREIGFALKRTIEDAVRDLKNAFDSRKMTDPLNNPMYFNIKRMQEVWLQ